MLGNFYPCFKICKYHTTFFHKNSIFNFGLFQAKFFESHNNKNNKRNILDVWFLRSKTEIENSIIKICSKSARNVSSLLCHRAKILYSISGISTHVQLGKKKSQKSKKKQLGGYRLGALMFFKGQKISKAIFLAFNSSKKTYKKSA